MDMQTTISESVQETVAAIYRTESRRVLATLIRLLHDFDLAEEALHDAFIAAVEQWPREGLPDNPRAWLVSTGRFKAIDKLRRRARYDNSLNELAGELEEAFEPSEAETLEDDRLRLIFTCCHPALTADAQVALTLREVCGLTTEEIASAFLTTVPALAQRIVRAKTRIRDAGIPYQVPERDALPERMDAVMRVIYLVYNEGYSASSGTSLLRHDLSSEAIRLGRLILELLPGPEIKGLLALMLLTESWRLARTSAEGDLILLENQDRTLWNRELIDEGLALVSQAFASGEVGTYTLQAAISAAHATADNFNETDWGQIITLYDLLLQAEPSPLVELNRAVAVAMRDGASAGLALIDAIIERGELTEYRLVYAARADLCRRLGKRDEARSAYVQALALARQEPERRYLQQQLDTW